MSNSANHRITQVLAIAAISTLFCSTAQAGGPAFTRLFGVADSAETAVLAPAGMTRLDDSQLIAQVILAQSFGEFEVDENLTTVSGGDPRTPDIMAVPSLYYVRPFAEDWRLGLSLMVPAGFGTSNGPNWSGRYYSDSFDLIFVSANATIAYPVTNWLSLGGGITIMGSTADSTTQVNSLGLDEPDARLRMEAEGVAVGAIASMMVELSPKTRFTVNWNSEVEPDEDPKVKLGRSSLPQDVVDAINDAGDDIDATIRVPQHVQMGLFHEFDNGWSATLDAIWVEFSEFGLTELSVEGDELSETDPNFQDFWIVSAGFGFPISDRMEGRVGAIYVEQPVKDEDRTFSFALDKVYGAGAGIHYTRANNHSYDLNLSVFNTGDAPIDTGPLSELSPRGRVVGETDSPYAVTLEFSYYWN